MIPVARVRSGQPYTGNQQFRGNGITRSCGKCKQHVPGDGGAKHRLLGWVCRGCKGTKE
jgi:hypothetical protein